MFSARSACLYWNPFKSLKNFLPARGTAARYSAEDAKVTKASGSGFWQRKDVRLRRRIRTEDRFGPADRKINNGIRPLQNTDYCSMLADLKFYDFHRLTSHCCDDFIVRYRKDDILRFGDAEAGRGSMNAYSCFEGNLLLFLKRAFQKIPDGLCCIVKYEEKWVINPDLNSELAKALDSKRITDHCDGIQCSKDHPVVSSFAKSCFRYNSFVQFVFPRTHLIITPTDHMDIFFSCDAEKMYKGCWRQYSQHLSSNI